jgi:hypothetical protein
MIAAALVLAASWSLPVGHPCVTDPLLCSPDIVCLTTRGTWVQPPPTGRLYRWGPEYWYHLEPGWAKATQCRPRFSGVSMPGLFPAQRAAIWLETDPRNGGIPVISEPSGPLRGFIGGRERVIRDPRPIPSPDTQTDPPREDY